MLAARAALLAREDMERAMVNFVDPVPERHKERLRRAFAKNLE